VIKKKENLMIYWPVMNGNSNSSSNRIHSVRHYVNIRIYVQKSHSFSLSDLDKLLHQAKHQKLIIIADRAEW
jgi:hypothetical protein